ncbi:MAG: NAD(P)/FAD-dependent oxidoreductase [Desulfobacteraceae bacterium]|nr:MAG: NAD(P)/FAD-dependent oxidoreductase [Desulfobacteraceae bacterium]
MSDKHILTLGAGPAGLAAAHELLHQNIRPIVFEQTDKVGGIARTETYKNYFFDIGGHRFFTKNDRVNKLWQEMMGPDFLKVGRMSRIYYKGRLFKYPLSIPNTLLNLGIFESALMMLSYLYSQIRPYPEEDTFDQWITNRFGRRLYETFFKTYTEKVWGISCNEIQAEWAAQRIKGLSLIAAVGNALLGIKKSKSLIDEFYYPVWGPGMMWQRFQETIEKKGGEVHLNTKAVGLNHKKGRIVSVAYRNGKEAGEMPVDHLISSIPITKLISLMNPEPPANVLNAARNLSYRAFIIVMLIIDQKHLFSDQWIYIHNPDVKVGRIQNFKNWSAAMVPDHSKSSIGMEYFCTEGDEIWTMPDRELIAIASRELAVLGLSDESKVLDSYVVRQPGAYPVYDSHYRDHLAVIKDYLSGFTNLQTIGRSGMHRYNNMDQSMHVGILAAQNILGADHNLWETNEEQEYLEEQEFTDATTDSGKALADTLSRMDKLAMATAVGSLTGIILFLATIWILLRGDGPAIQKMMLLNQYFMGYTVSIGGAFQILFYGFLCGFMSGWLFAYTRNLFLACHIYRIKKKNESLSLLDFFDNL